MIKLSTFPYTLLLLLLILVIPACATRAPVDDSLVEQNWQNKRRQLENIQSWNINGRVAIQMPDDSGSATLHWQQQGNSYKIRIIAPFGRGNIEITGDEAGVSMNNTEGETVTAADAETLMLENLGWQVPVSVLYYWIRGIPAPGLNVEDMRLDQEARLSELSQAGWQVSYDRYRVQGELSLPEKMQLQGRNIRVKLFIKKWQTDT